VKLTQEQKRIKLAEAAGWKGISKTYLEGYAPWRPVAYEKRINKTPVKEFHNIPLDPLPDYFSDLNAVCELESKLTHQQHLTFRKKLWDIAITLGPDDVWDRHYISPTAAQRAEALGLTLNLWTSRMTFRISLSSVSSCRAKSAGTTSQGSILTS